MYDMIDDTYIVESLNSFQEGVPLSILSNMK